MRLSIFSGRTAAACSVLALAGVTSPLLAQDADQPPGSERRAVLDQIVVTAQRREERLQDAPLSVQALSGDDMHDQGIASIKDLQTGAVPSVRMAPFFGRASAVALSMRGIASGDVTQISRDPSFGIYVDGVYLGRVQGLGVDLLDVERMEVLRGPQGTLFGRNAVGGALNIVSRRPSGVFGLRQRAGVSNYNGRSTSMSLDLPEMAGVSVKIDGLYSVRDGWVSNPFGDDDRNADFNAEKKKGLRVAALWEPMDTLELLYAYDISRDRQTSGYPHIDSFVDDRDRVPLIGVDDGRVSSSRLPAPLQPSVGKVEGHTLHATWELNEFLTLRSITSYREMEQTQQDQWAGAFPGPDITGLGVGHPMCCWTGRLSLAEVKQDQFSQEFQLLGSTPRLEYVLGGFWFEEDAEDSADTNWTLQYTDGGTAVRPLDLLRPSRASEADARSRALFAQGTWTPPIMDDRLDVTLGLRYTDDKKSGALVSEDPVLAFDFESDRFDPLVVLAYRWTEDLNTYLRWGTAYRAGGANSRSEEFNPFGDEEVSAWELGLKADFWDGRGRLNLAAFHMDYDDQQFTFTSPFNPSISETVNIEGTVKIRGLEADLELAPLPGLRLNFNYAFTDVDSPRVRNPFFDQAPDVVDDEFFQPRGGMTPKHAAAASVDYQFEPFSFGTLRARLDANYSDSLVVSALSRESTDSYVLLNGRLVLQDMRLRGTDADLELALWGRNLLDREYVYYTGTLNAVGFSGANVTWYGQPRTYGLEATLRF